jgi:hypothetical protein
MKIALNQITFVHPKKIEIMCTFVLSTFGYIYHLGKIRLDFWNFILYPNLDDTVTWEKETDSVQISIKLNIEHVRLFSENVLLLKYSVLTYRVRIIIFNANFNNISAISWRSVLLVEETRVPGENHRPVASHWQTLSHKAVSNTLCSKRDSSSQISSDRYWLHRKL